MHIYAETTMLLFLSGVFSASGMITGNYINGRIKNGGPDAFSMLQKQKVYISKPDNTSVHI